MITLHPGATRRPGRAAAAEPPATTPQFVGRFLVDYARNPMNLLVLVLVPTVFVMIAAGSLADAARLLGGPGGPAVHTATAGWAAGFLAAVAMYFQMRSARAADRRLVLAGLRPARLVTARMATGFTLALFAATAALLALAARTGLAGAGRTAAGTVMFALIYLAVGAMVGAVAANPVNGTALILFVWITDVFLGPVMGSADRTFTRVLPTHFVTLWMVDLPSRHAGRIGDLGWALAWTLASVLLSWIVVRAATRIARLPHHAPPGSLRDQLAAGLRLGLRAQARNRILWVLLAAVPAVFVLLSVPTTPDKPAMFSVREGGRAITERLSLRDVHPGTMAPLAVASLAVLAGMFVVLEAQSADRRLRLAGFRTSAALGAHLAVVIAAAVIAAAGSLLVTTAVFDARQWGVYAAANLLIAATYALIGVILGPIFGRVAGVFIAFLVPSLDLAIVQSPMLHANPPAWGHMLPGYGASRVLIDGALTPTFDETGALLLAIGWLAALTVVAALMFHRAAGSAPSRGLSPAAGPSHG